MKYRDISLKYLYKDRQKSLKQEDISSSYLENALRMYSLPILSFLKKKKDRQARVFDLAKNTKINIREIFQIISALELRELVEVIEKDEAIGNDLIKITEDGSKLIE